MEARNMHKTQEMDAKFHRYLIRARKLVVIADHRIDKHVNEEQVREMLAELKSLSRQRRIISIKHFDHDDLPIKPNGLGVAAVRQ